MRYDSNNGLRIQQAYVAANDFKQIFYQKNNSVDTAAMTIYKGNVGIGNTDPGTYKLNVTGNINTSGTLTTTGNISTSGELVVSGNKIGISGTYPTLYLRHTNSAYRSAMLHCNGNTFYILGAPYGGTITQDNWETVGSGRWPLTIDLTNNNAVFGGNVNCTNIYCDGTFQARGNCYFQQNLWHLDGNANYRFYFGGGSTSYWSGNFAANLSPAHEWRLGYNQATLGVLYNNGQMIMSSYGTFSDRRIKKDIEEINDDEALNILLLVQPTKYKYIDEERNTGTGKVYGFIAQQIHEVMPEAVSIKEGLPPNIYKTCLISNKRKIYCSIPQDVPIDTEVVINFNDKGNRYKIKEIYEDHFIIDQDIDADECFVFGYSIPDLHGINKDYIFTINVCATQELHRRMEAQKIVIQSQEERIKELEAKLEKLINYIYQ